MHMVRSDNEYAGTSGEGTAVRAIPGLRRRARATKFGDLGNPPPISPAPLGGGSGRLPRGSVVCCAARTGGPRSEGVPCP
jgi:hypothetical protein